MRLILVRHGETQSNKEGLSLGRGEVPLNDKGRAQMEAVAEALASERVDAIYCSPLARCVEGATIIGGRLGLPLREETGLAEMDVGEMEGQAFPAMRDRYPDFFREWLSEGVADVRPPGGESLRDVQARAWTVVGRIAEAHEPNETAVAVTHNFVVLTILCEVLDMPIGRFRRLRQDLGGITVLDMRPDRIVVSRLNDTCHLEERGLADGIGWPLGGGA